MTVRSRGMTAVLAVPVVMITAVVVAPAAASAAPDLPLYRYVSLGVAGKARPGGAYSIGAGLNNTRTVVGASTATGAFELQAFSWRAGTFNVLGTFSSSPYAAGDASAVNDNGVVVGQTSSASDTEPSHAFRYSGGVLTDLGAGFGPGVGSSASDVNDSGVVVGSRSGPQSGPTQAVVWRDGHVIELGTFGGQAGQYGDDSYASAVNESGQVVGAARTPEDGLHAFLWDGGALQDLGTLGGTTEATAATDINDRGVVVGESQNRAGEVHAVRWRNGNARDLGTLGGNSSTATAVNNPGQVVGSSRIDTIGNDNRAFLWQDGEMVDLNDRVPDLPAGVVLHTASDINNQGVIVGSACPRDCEPDDYGTRRAFMLIPLQ